MAQQPVRIFQYWVGPQPPWIKLCLEIGRRNCPGIEVLDDSFWDTTYSGEIPVDTIRRQLPAVQSDILRSYLLHAVGGIWVDADCIIWRDLRPISSWLKRYDFVTYRVYRGWFCSALLAAFSTSQIASEYWRLIVAKMATVGRGRVHFLAVGPNMLRKAIRTVGDRRCRLLRSQWVHPLHWRQNHKILQPGAPPVHPWAWCWMLTHETLGPLRTASREEILASDTWAGALFRRGLGLPAIPG